MKKHILLAFALLIGIGLKAQELELISVKQIQNLKGERFDLSGITFRNDSIFVVADKVSNPYIYLLEETKKGYDVSPWKYLKSEGFLIDYEGVAQANGVFYLINEKTSELLKIQPDGKVKGLPIQYKKAHLKPSRWRNAGLEGLAVDGINHFIYLAKERQPRFILQVKEETGEILKKYQPKNHGMDFSDLCYADGYLYALIRSAFKVIKIDPKAWEVVASVSYKQVAKPEEQKLFEPYKFGMAEALLLINGEIWIGLDNNKVKASVYGMEKYGLQGDSPAILRFKRPESF